MTEGEALVETPTLTRSPSKTESTTSFLVPSRKVITQADLDLFLTSDLCHSILLFIESLSQSVQGLPNSHPVSNVTRVLELLNEIEKILENVPPENHPNSRFGNPSFRMFYDKTQLKIPELLQQWVTPVEAVEEVSEYLEKSFGDRKRVDYGTGHELHFLCFLLCLYRLNLIKKEDHSAVVLKVFFRYFHLMRRIQSTYWLEPAGSHGVWGLDDYHFLPFLFGASQLIGHRYLRPKAIHDVDLMDHLHHEYMYLDCILHVHRLKTVPMKWHSPMLDDISAVKSWDQIERGLRKMYKGEVLSKLPILQHVLMGHLLSFTNVSGKSITDQDLEATDGHAHVYAMGEAFPTCCGMRLPSAHAAKLAAQKKQGVLPFD